MSNVSIIYPKRCEDCGKFISQHSARCVDHEQLAQLAIIRELEQKRSEKQEKRERTLPYKVGVFFADVLIGIFG